MKNTCALLFVILLLASCRSTGNVAKSTPTVADVETTENLGFEAQKWRNDIDFYAMGNEPFWSLDINTENEIRFTNMEGDPLIFTKSDVTWSKSGIYAFTASDEATEFSFRAIQESCPDRMADKTFAFAVTIEVRLKGESNATRFSGCGNFVPDYRLNGKWQLDQLGDEKALETDFYHKIPIFTFDMEALRFGGSSGCNMISAKICMQADKLRFEQLISTLMACPQGNEDALKQAIEATRSYIIKGNNLRLKDENNLQTLTLIKRE